MSFKDDFYEKANVINAQFSDIDSKKTKRKRDKNKKYISIFAILIILSVIFTGMFCLNDLYIDFLWFKEVGYLQMFFNSIKTKLMLGIPIFVVFLISLLIYFKTVAKAININKITNIIFICISVILSFGISFIATNKLWYKFLEFINASSFNKVDPIFNKDISFYIFKLPFYQSLLKILGVLVLLIFAISVIISLISRLFFNSSTKSTFFEYIKTAFGSLILIIFIFLGLYFYFARFDVLYSYNGVTFGAGYTDVVIKVRIYTILTFLCIALGIISLFSIKKGKIKPCIASFGIIALMLVLNTGLTYVVGHYIVEPNQYSKENKYIQNNINMTRSAYNLDIVKTKKFPANQDLTYEDIKENNVTISNIPINDFEPTLDMYNSLQGFRPYYVFHDIDVDRYTLDDVATQTFISIREMDTDKLEDDAKNWINIHMKYTHGFGSVMSTVKDVDSSGQPVLIQKDIPPINEYESIKEKQSRIYYGELTDEYAVVKAKSGEFDYPKGSDNKENIYKGTGGISLKGYNKIAFSIKYWTNKLLLNTDITSNSKIMINRNIAKRVKKIAPFLSYDDDPYIVNANGKLYWIIDAFTTSNKYPYSTKTKLNGSEEINYIRNSIKVVVDAYNGDVTFYQSDKTDSIATCLSKIYPDFLKPMEEMDEALKEHMRYSETLFNIQSDVYKTYHMTNPTVFYNKEDLWHTAKQFYGSTKDTKKVNSVYSIMKLPDREEEFLLMVPFTPSKKDNMIAWMAGICDGEDYGRLIVYEFPKQKLVYGPMQIEQRIDQDTTIAPQISLLSQGGAEVLRGNMIIVPVENSILYVEPIYVRSSGKDETMLPEVKKVIVAYKNKIVMKDTLDDALKGIFLED